MKVTRKLTRRSFMARVAGGAALGGAALTIVGSRAEALQASDNDQGSNADASGRGRTGVNDNDSGNNSDRPGFGRGTRQACSDNDTGSNADVRGRGRGNGVSDNDSGNNSDPPRCGRGRR